VHAAYPTSIPPYGPEGSRDDSFVAPPPWVTMRVLLVNPYLGFLSGRRGPVYDRPFPPVELVNLAGLLRRDGHEVQLLDAARERLWPLQVASRARGFDRAFITSSNLDRWCCPEVDVRPFVETARALARVCGDSYLLGAHPTALPQAMLLRTGARAAIIGEPELTAAELARKGDPRGVAGAAWLDRSGTLQRGSPRSPMDLDELPVPAYELLQPDVYQYELLGGDLMVFEYSRGCPYRCSFCHRSMYGDDHRPKSLDRLWAEIEHARVVLGVRRAYFMDVEFTLDRERVLALCERLTAAGTPLRWCCQTRVDRVDPELLAAMRGAGCELVHFGVEAGSQRVLDSVGKGITMDQCERAMAWCREAGLRTACFFLAGLPGQTPADLDDTLRFAHRLAPTYASFHVAVPYPGSELFQRLSSPPSDTFPTHLSDEFELDQLEAWVRWAFLSYYLRPSALARRLLTRDLFRAGRLLPIFMWYLG